VQGALLDFHDEGLALLAQGAVPGVARHGIELPRKAPDRLQLRVVNRIEYRRRNERIGIQIHDGRRDFRQQDFGPQQKVSLDRRRQCAELGVEGGQLSFYVRQSKFAEDGADVPVLEFNRPVAASRRRLHVLSRSNDDR